MTSASPRWMVLQGVADGVGGRGAGGGDGRVRPAQAEVDRDVAGGGVGHHLGDDEGADLAGAAFDVAGVLLLELVEAADAAADDDAAAVRVFLGEVEAAVLDGVHGGDHGELGEAVQPA